MIVASQSLTSTSTSFGLTKTDPAREMSRSGTVLATGNNSSGGTTVPCNQSTANYHTGSTAAVDLAATSRAVRS